MKNLNELKTNIIKKIDNINQIINTYEIRFYDNEEYLCVNVKCYDYLDEDDVKSLVDNYTDITPEQKSELIEHFSDENKLNDIFWHTIEMERDCLSDFIKDISLENTYNTDFRNIISYQGRNGGWLCLEDVFDKDYVGGVIYSDYFDLEEIKTICEKKGLQFFRELKAFGSDLRYTLEQLEYFGEELENTLNKLMGFDEVAQKAKLIAGDFKSSLIDQLDYEIEQYIDEEFNLKEKHINTLEISEEEIITDYKAKVTLKEAKEALIKLKQGILKTGDKIGNYTFVKTINEEGKILVKVGCHLFDLQHLENKLN